MLSEGFAEIQGICEADRLRNRAEVVVITALDYKPCTGKALSVTTVFSVLIFKEKMKWWRWCGVAVGAVAVVLLSI